jgi:hypothetical protein
MHQDNSRHFQQTLSKFARINDASSKEMTLPVKVIGIVGPNSNKKSKENTIMEIEKEMIS